MLRELFCCCGVDPGAGLYMPPPNAGDSRLRPESRCEELVSEARIGLGLPSFGPAHTSLCSMSWYQMRAWGRDLHCLALHTLASVQ